MGMYDSRILVLPLPCLTTKRVVLCNGSRRVALVGCCKICWICFRRQHPFQQQHSRRRLRWLLYFGHCVSGAVCRTLTNCPVSQSWHCNCRPTVERGCATPSQLELCRTCEERGLV